MMNSRALFARWMIRPFLNGEQCDHFHLEDSKALFLWWTIGPILNDERFMNTSASFMVNKFNIVQKCLALIRKMINMSDVVKLCVNTEKFILKLCVCVLCVLCVCVCVCVFVCVFVCVLCVFVYVFVCVVCVCVIIDTLYVFNKVNKVFII